MGIKIKLKDKCFWGTKNPDVVRNIFDIMKLRGGPLLGLIIMLHKQRYNLDIFYLPPCKLNCHMS